MKFSISFKLLFGLSLLIFGMTASISYFNSEYLKKTILQRERDFNLSLTESKAREVESYLDKQVALISFITKQLAGARVDEAELFRNHPDFFSVEIVSILQKLTKQSAKNPAWLYTDTPELTAARNKFKENLLQQVKQNPDRMITINSSGYYPASAEQKQPTILTIVLPYSKIGNSLDQVVFANFNTRYLQRLFANTKLGSVKLFNDWGYSIASSDEKYLLNTQDISKTELFSFIRKYPLPNYSGLYEIEQKSNMISFAKTQNGVFLLSEVPADILLAPAELMSLMTLRLSGYFLTGSLFLLFVFSLNLTRPLGKLAEISLEIAKGNFDHNPSTHLKQFFKDEVHTLAIAVERMVKGLRERDRFRTLFNKFHGSAVTEDLMKNEIALRGEKKSMFVFFSDLRGFTNLSEAKDPAQVVELLNEYFSQMVPVINKYGGVVDKFIGDAIMAVWGVPAAKPNDGKNALMACIKMRQALEILNKTRAARGEPELWIGMALHFGEAISGTIGSEERMEYTVIGNTINTASRIEASTKAFGTDLLVSEEVKAQLPDFLYSVAGSVEVKGRSEALNLFKVNGYIAEDGKEIEVTTRFSAYAAEAADKVKIVA